MGDEKPMGERIAVLETEMRNLKENAKWRAVREWGIFVTCFGLLLTIIANSFGWIK